MSVGLGDVLAFFRRHLLADWGELGDEDRQLNDDTLLLWKAGKTDLGRLFSAYELPDGGKLWIITDAPGYATTALLPEESVRWFSSLRRRSRS